MSESADVGVDEDVDGDGDLNVAVGDEPTGHVAVAVAVAVHDNDNDNDNVEVHVEGFPCRFDAERAARGFARPFAGNSCAGWQRYWASDPEAV